MVKQRLTTILILLAAIRDKSKSLPGNLSGQIADLLLLNRYQEGLDEFKLLPTQQDRDSFTNLIKGNPVGQTDHILEAYRYFEHKLHARADISLDRLKKIVIDSLVVVSIVLERDDNPYLIFESLNAKGRPLSPGRFDSQLLLHADSPAGPRKIYAAQWKPMQDELGDDLTECIRHFLMKDGAVVKQGEVYYTLKERADRHPEPELVDYLKTLAQFAGYYANLLHPEKEPSVKLRERLIRLNRIEVTTAYPFLLNIYHDYATGKTSEADFAGVLDILENFMIRRFICGVPTYGLNKVFPTLYAQASPYPSLIEGVKAGLRDKRYPSDAEFTERIISSPLYASGERAARIKLILERLENSFEHQEPASFATLSVEHIMPQTLTQWWKDHLGDQWKETYNNCVDTIGNLTLTGYNPTLSNADFPTKQAIYKESHWN